jgi:hypothetical protein
MRCERYIVHDPMVMIALAYKITLLSLKFIHLTKEKKSCIDALQYGVKQLSHSVNKSELTCSLIFMMV